MNYPLISEYIEAIKAAEDNFEELTNLRLVLGDDGQPVMTSGNFAVVFKMRDVETGKFYALKCFTKEQKGRAEAYHQIADALKDVDSPYLVSLRYLDKELFVDTEQTAETEFPVLLMDWVEGKTLDKYLRENLDDKYALEMLAYRFSQLAQWLIPQPFAHGDLKPDNILVREDGSLVLVDYDGMYVPAMKGQKARELGSPDFRHPLRTENDFDEHIDDFSFVSILLSLKAISQNPHLLEEYGASDRLLLSASDYIDLCNSIFLKSAFPSNNEDLNLIYSVFLIAISLDFDTSFKHILSIFHPTFCVPSNIKVVYNNEELNMVFVKGGTFIMGAQSDNPSLPNYDKEAKPEEGPVRHVKISDFWISDSLVPMEMWPNCTYDRYYDEIVKERKRSIKTDNERFGAYGASYERCEEFITELNKKTSLQFDFPTEEEWEYAARGGCRSMGYKYAGSDDINEVAQYGISIDGGLCALKQKAPNELGIFDMSGSLYEWCKGLKELQSVKGVNPEIINSYCKDKYFFPEIKLRVKRGGSRSTPADKCRITNRECNVVCRNSIFDEPYQELYLTDIVSGSSLLDDSFKNEFKEKYYWEEYYSGQVGLRLVLRNLIPQEKEYSTTITKEDLDNAFVDEYGVAYSADKKRLLKGPTEIVIKGNHKWTKGVLSGTYFVRPGTKCICDRAFLNCCDLNSLILPQSVKQIGVRSFQGCSGLCTVDLNEGLIKIGDNAFQDCKKLRSIHLPESLKQVGNNAFYGCMIKVIFSNYE
jgi:formylglycine-generating enzyme required for sulfatase activity